MGQTSGRGLFQTPSRVTRPKGSGASDQLFPFKPLTPLRLRLLADDKAVMRARASR